MKLRNDKFYLYYTTFMILMYSFELIDTDIEIIKLCIYGYGIYFLCNTIENK